MTDIQIRFSKSRLKNYRLKIFLICLAVGVFFALIPPFNAYPYGWLVAIVLPLIAIFRVKNVMDLDRPVIELSDQDLKVIYKGAKDYVVIPWKEVLDARIEKSIYITLKLRDKFFWLDQLSLYYRIQHRKRIQATVLGMDDFTFSTLCLDIDANELVKMIKTRAMK